MAPGKTVSTRPSSGKSQSPSPASDEDRADRRRLVLLGLTGTALIMGLSFTISGASLLAIESAKPACDEYGRFYKYCVDEHPVRTAGMAMLASGLFFVAVGAGLLVALLWTRRTTTRNRVSNPGASVFQLARP